MNKKKIFSIVVVCLIGTTLFGCGGNKGSANDSSVKDVFEEIIGEFNSSDNNKNVDEKENKNTLGNLSGNLSNGGLVASNDNYIVFAKEDGLWKTNLENNKTSKITSGKNINSINIKDDYIYYLEGDFREYEPISIKIDGSDKKVIGDIGNYTDFTVVNNKIYYIKSNGKIGYSKYTYMGEEHNYQFDYNKSIYSMNLDGSDLTEVVEDLGNLSPRMSITEDKIFYFTEYATGVVQGGFSKYYSTDIDGNNKTEIINLGNNEAYGGGYISSELGGLAINTGIIAGDNYIVITDLSDGTGCNYQAVYRYSLTGKESHNGKIAFKFIGGQAVIDGDTLYFYGAREYKYGSDVQVGIYKVELNNIGNMELIKDFGTYEDIESAPSKRIFLAKNKIYCYNSAYDENEEILIFDVK